MKILITGANGFIGSYCMEYFNNLGYDVTGLVRQRPTNNKYKYIIHDLKEEIKIEEKFNVIIHAASELDKVQKKMNVYVEGNIIGTKNLLKYAENHACALINLSGVRSFGTVKDCVISENTGTNNLEGYGITKYISEKMVLESNIPTISLILPGIVGKNGHTPWLMRITRKMMIGETIECYGPKELFNNILHVDTLAECMHKVIQQNIFPNERILLGSRNPMMKYDLLLELKKNLASQSEVIVVENDSMSFILDLTKAEKYELVMRDVKEEIERLTDDFKDNNTK